MLDLLFGLPWWSAIVATGAVLLLAVELGFRLAGFPSVGAPHERMAAQVSVLVGAILALLGLLLAFSFTIVEARFSARKALVLDEANAIGTTYLRAKLLPEPHAGQIRRQLRQYVELRLSPKTPSELEDAIQRSERLHAQLWGEAEAVAAGILAPRWGGYSSPRSTR